MFARETVLTVAWFKRSANQLLFHTNTIIFFLFSHKKSFIVYMMYADVNATRMCESELRMQLSSIKMLEFAEL